MGGDDLGSDDEFLPGKVDEASGPESEKVAVRKRKLSSSDEESDGRPSKSSNATPEQWLLETAREIGEKPQKDQAAFLQKALLHHSLLSSNKKSRNTLSPKNIARLPSQGSCLERLKGAVSAKKLKNWKQVQSPLVLFVCISARRAVSILKDLSALKIRMAKLFPKSGSVEDQSKLLSSQAFGLAMGTPHRLHVLTQTGALRFDHTQLLVLDCDVSNKQYTVLTLPDTAPHCIKLLQDFILPQLEKRDDMRIAFF